MIKNLLSKFRKRKIDEIPFDILYKNTDIEKRIMSSIGWYFFEKNKYVAYATEKEIRSMEIDNVKMYKNFIYIYTSRPGVVIGSKGENIRAIEQFIKKHEPNIHFNRIKLKEINHLRNLYTWSYGIER